jgi:hypothetical protein
MGRGGADGEGRGGGDAMNGPMDGLAPDGDEDGDEDGDGVAGRGLAAARAEARSVDDPADPAEPAGDAEAIGG